MIIIITTTTTVLMLLQYHSLLCCNFLDNKTFTPIHSFVHSLVASSNLQLKNIDDKLLV